MNKIIQEELFFSTHKKDSEYERALVKMDNILARKNTKFNAFETKFFLTILSQIRTIDEDFFVKLSRREVVSWLQIDKTNASKNKLRRALKKLAEKSYVEFGDYELFNDGFLITNYLADKDNIFVKINSSYLSLLIELKEKYTVFHLKNIINFKSKFSIILFQYLKMKFTGEFLIHRVRLTTNELKNLFGLEKNDYCKRDGSFDRSNFEKKTIKLAIQEINKNKNCRLKIEELKKNYNNKFVANYEIAFSLINKEGFRTEKQLDDYIEG